MVAKFSRVLVTTDFSEVADQAVPYAYSILDQGGEVLLLHIIEHQNQPSPLYAHYSADELNNPEKRQEAAAKVEERLKSLIPKAADEQRVTTKVSVGFHPQVASGIVEEVKSHNSDVVVIGSHGHGALASLLLGSVAEEVLRASPVPILIVPHK